MDQMKSDQLKSHQMRSDHRVAEQARVQTREINGFDYDAPAELFLRQSRTAKSRPRYERFDTAAQALRFVIERLPAAILPGAYLLVEETRFGADEMRYLYDSAGYPLPRAIGNH